MAIYTRKGDDGTTGLLYGGRAGKDAAWAEACGDVDEAQAVLGLARSRMSSTELDGLMVSLQRDLWVLMAELATDASQRHRLAPGTTMVTPEMVERLEATIDRYSSLFDPPKEFAVPGQDGESASLDLARAVVRRAERSAVRARLPETSRVVPYLNRLSDLLWTLARWRERDFRPARQVP